MTRPGDRLRALAAHVFDAETMDHLIDPVVADLQLEYAEATRSGRMWRGRWVRLAGYVAFARVTTRTLRAFLALTFATTLLMELPPLTRFGMKFVVPSLVYLAPQALVLAVPMALTLAIAWAGRRAPRTRQSIRGTIAAGAVCSMLSFVILAWLVPPANQAFRVAAAHEAGLASPSPPGPSEMTIGELRKEMKRWTAIHTRWRELEFQYYFRWAFGFASLPLALLMTALRRRSVRRQFMLVGAVASIVGYYVLMFFGRLIFFGHVVESGILQAVVGAWMPNLVTVLMAAVIAMLGTRRLV